MKKLIFTFTGLFIFNASADIDNRLSQYIQEFRLKAVKPVKITNEAKYELGKKLFFSKELSGNRNVSCATCHDPQHGTGDGLPLSLGEGAKDNIFPRVATRKDQILPRNSQPLYNLKNAFIMFADGRVSYDGFEFNTPEPALNGESPDEIEITDALGSALAAQALFPIVDDKEMKGINNEFSKLTNLQVWNRIVSRVLENKELNTLIKNSFPNQKINIGHLGNALAEFQSYEFQVVNTPWDEYLRGNKNALSPNEKRGAEVFFTSGKCIQCHKGSMLGGNSFENIASPQIGPGKDIRHNDEGRFLVTRRQEDLYKFKVPALRNIAKTAPYFHAGSYSNLRDVISHYTKGTRALEAYSDDWLIPFEKTNYGKQLFVERDSYMLFRKKENSHHLMRARRIRLNENEKNNLLLFLEKSLSD